MKKIIIFILITININCGSFFLPDSDTAMLISVVSNTASTVTNTLKILETAKDTAEKIDKYNSIAMRRYFIARRIEQHARDIANIKKMKPRNLRQFNNELRRLKSTIKSLKSRLDVLGVNLIEAQKFSENTENKK